MPSSHWNKGKLPKATLIGLCRLEMSNYFKLRCLEFQSEEGKLNRQFMRKCQMQMRNLCGTFQLSSIPTSIPSAFAIRMPASIVEKHSSDFKTSESHTWGKSENQFAVWLGPGGGWNWFYLVWAVRCDKWGPFVRRGLPLKILLFAIVKILCDAIYERSPSPSFMHQLNQ